MIFLLDNGKYKILPPDIPQDKFEKKYAKWKDKLKFVLVENNSSSRSDCYSIVEAKRFSPRLKPMTIRYTYGYKEPDMPFTSDNTFTQTIVIDSIQKKYAVHNLIEQAFSFGFSTQVLTTEEKYSWNGGFGPDISLIRFEIETKDDVVTWDSTEAVDLFTSKGRKKLPWNSIYEMLASYDMITCCEILDSQVDKQPASFMAMVRNYLQSENLTSNNHRALMLFNTGEWALRDVNIVNLFDRVRYQEYLLPDGKLVAVGVHIPQSQVVYLMSETFAHKISKINIFSLEERYTFEGDERIDMEGYDTPLITHIATSIGSILNLCLILPQKWELDRYVYGIRYLNVKFALSDIHKDTHTKVLHLSHPTDRGLEIDLFMFLAALL